MSQSHTSVKFPYFLTFSALNYTHRTSGANVVAVKALSLKRNKNAKKTTYAWLASKKRILKCKTSVARSKDSQVS
jgi:hypothetical protein